MNLGFISRNLHSLRADEKNKLFLLTNRRDGNRSIFAELLELQDVKCNNILIIAINANDIEDWVGWAMIWGWEHRVAKIGIYVHPYFRRLGVGRALIKRMSSVAEALGLSVEPRPFTDIGISFYKNTLNTLSQTG